MPPKTSTTGSGDRIIGKTLWSRLHPDKHHLGVGEGKRGDVRVDDFGE